MTVINVDVLMGRMTVWHLARIVPNVVARTTLEKCAGPKRSNKFKSESKHDSRKPSKANGRYTHKCRVHEINECQNDMENLNEQVQSLFYS